MRAKPSVFTVDDVALALRRVRLDHAKHRVFVTSPVEDRIVAECEDEWLGKILEEVALGKYAPGPSLVCDVPKGNFSVRPAALLSFADQVVYTLCVGKVVGLISTAMGWANPSPDCSYEFEEIDAVNWLKNRFICWTEFRKRSLASLDSGAPYLVSADIAGYYDNIQIEILVSDLRGCGAPGPVVDLLAKCLNRWAIVAGRGIPQGLSASDVLAKLYLNNVDQALAHKPHNHLRYVDDFRAFCASRAEAKEMLLALSRVLRRRGLALQSAKTRILHAATARTLIEGAVPTLRPLIKGYISEIAVLANEDPNYFSQAEAEAFLAQNDVDPPTDLIRKAYAAHVMERGGDFNRTILHYLLARLANARDDFAYDHALSLLVEFPEESEHVLRYAAAVRDPRDAEPALVKTLRSKDAVYPYQHYLVLRWRFDFASQPSDLFLGYARGLMREGGDVPFLQSAARLVLAKFGTAADLEAIGDSYANDRGEVAKAEVLCALHRMEKVRRNSIVGRSKDEGLIVRTAVSLVRDDRLADLFEARP